MRRVASSSITALALASSSSRVWSCTGDEERQVDVLVAGGFEAGVELSLEDFPDGVTVGFDDHAAFDDFGRFGDAPGKTTS